MNSAIGASVRARRRAGVSGCAGRAIARALLLAAALAGAACEEELRLPTDPTPGSTTTDTFTGTLAPNGTSAHPFAVQDTGFLTVSVVSLDPLVEITVGVGLGAPSGASCTLQLKNDAARVGSILTAAINTAGSYCVAIYDTGNVSEAISYSISVVHP